MRPKWPLYIVSKGRWESRLTMKALELMQDVEDWLVVIERQELEHYAAVIPRRRLLVLDPAYQEAYDACDRYGLTRSKGSGPARNFVWDHAAARGADWHWIMDDNIRDFHRLNRNLKVRVYDGVFFRIMEDLVERYTNVGMAGPNYEKFMPRTRWRRPLTVNTRIFSCNLIRTGLPLRWRCRYNEDADLSLRVLKAGWCTVQINPLLQGKITTQTMKGGNTDELYARGTLEKSRMLVRLHPDCTRLVWRYNRWHHHVDFSKFRHPLRRRPGLEELPEVDEYGLLLDSVRTA